VLCEVSPGPCAKADLLSAFIATSITIRERASVQEVFKASRQPTDIFDAASACDQRAKQAGDVDSALVLLQLGVALKLSPIRIPRGELRLSLGRGRGKGRGKGGLKSDDFRKRQFLAWLLFTINLYCVAGQRTHSIYAAIVCITDKQTSSFNFFGPR